MKITEEMLRRYVQGKCTEKERIAIESWIPDISDITKRLSQSTLDNQSDLMWRFISHTINQSQNKENTQTHWKRSPKVISMYKKAVRLISAACIIFAAFLGGRASANSGVTYIIKDKTQPERLYVFGGNGGKGSLPGDIFRIDFNGTLRLFNSTTKQQTILVGDSIFVLQSKRSYFLKGSTDHSTLSEETPSLMMGLTGDELTEGNFSLYRRDSK
ncbi:MAG: hypothetical protein AAGF77_01530 [Bacteroidota bacterium]